MTLQIFIKRPVLSTVISVIIVILGILGLIALPITQYPEIAPPTVQVQASYPGANADVVPRIGRSTDSDNGERH